jgi:hypothetical protein
LLLSFCWLFCWGSLNSENIKFCTFSERKVEEN